MDDKYINDKVYANVAIINNVAVSEVERVMGCVSKAMRDTIVNDDPKVSLKLDYIGNLYSKDKQREKIQELDEKKNGRHISISR